jgi:ABC-type nitrate/sulfonate/bicarbonate transport system ATPase subunit
MLFAFPLVSDADVYLLDDPLAAVDAHVGQHLYERCITALAARGKCVVLVTNAVQFLRGATAIAVVKDGQVGRSLATPSLALTLDLVHSLSTALSLSSYCTPFLIPSFEGGGVRHLRGAAPRRRGLPRHD